MSNFTRLLTYLKPCRARVGIAVVLMLLVTLSTLPMPRITQYMVQGGFVTLITDILTLLVVIPVIYWMDWRLACIALAVVPLYVVNYKLFLRRIRPLSEEIREKWDALIGALQEKLAGISVVKAFAREEYETERFLGT